MSGTSEPLIAAALRGATYEERMQAITALGASDDEQATEALLDVLYWDCEGGFGVRERDPRSVDAPRYSQTDAERKLRFAAAEELAKKRDPSLIRSLIGGLSPFIGRELGIRMTAIVKAFGGSEAADILLTVVRGDPQALDRKPSRRRAASYARVLAAEALGDLRDARAVEPLIAALRENDARMREASAEALGKIGDPRAVDALMEAVVTSFGKDLFARSALHAVGGKAAEDRAWALIKEREEKQQAGSDLKRRAREAVKEAEQTSKGDEWKRPKLP